MFCKSCGSSVEEGVKFCTKCGMPVESAFQSTNSSNVESAAQPTMADNRNKRGMKKAIVLLAIFALCTLFISKITAEISDYNLMLGFGMISEGFLHYLFVENAVASALVIILPLICSGLFILFCSMIDKKSPALTGIPLIISLIAELALLVLRLIQHVQFTVINTITTFLGITLSVAFIIFYMVTVTERFKSGTAGKVLTIVIGCILRLLYLVSTIYNIVFYVNYYGATNGITVFACISSLLGIASSILTLIALLMCVFYTAKPREKSAYVATPITQQCVPVQLFCPKCGIRFPEGKKFCDQCGSELSRVAQTDQQYTYNNPSYSNIDPQDAPSGGYAALGFFFPVVGLILYLVWKDRMPLRSKSAGKGALAGVITSVSLSILTWLIYFIWLSSLLH